MFGYRAYVFQKYLNCMTEGLALREHLAEVAGTARPNSGRCSQTYANGPPVCGAAGAHRVGRVGGSGAPSAPDG